MTLGQRLLLHAASDVAGQLLNRSIATWGCLVTTSASPDDLRSQLAGADYDLVLVAPSMPLRQLVDPATVDATAELTLAEVEKRHILRVLAATGGNKSRAARTLGIDPKTLYSKLKSYGASEAAARRRQGLPSPSLR